MPRKGKSTRGQNLKGFFQFSGHTTKLIRCRKWIIFISDGRTMCVCHSLLCTGNKSETGFMNESKIVNPLSACIEHLLMSRYGNS